LPGQALDTRLAGIERLARGRLLTFTQRRAATGPFALGPRPMQTSLCVLDRQLHDKLGALTVLMKHLGGLPNERPAEVTNNTQINVITASSAMRR
jgi:hypothetical protein